MSLCLIENLTVTVTIFGHDQNDSNYIFKNFPLVFCYEKQDLIIC